MDFTALPGNGLLTDFYELTMTQAYVLEERTGRAVFSLFPRSLPDSRNYLVACGLDDALSYLENLRFTQETIEYLATLKQFSDTFLSWLSRFRFTGDVRAVPEGTIMFPGEPFLEITAPLPEAQLVETMLINRIHAQTLAATKCARIVTAARGRAVLDFGLRRMHGTEGAVKNARAYHMAGAAGTSNVLAGMTYDIPVVGTMAHSYVQSHETEYEAFRAFIKLYPETVLLVDTYDVMKGVENVIRLAHELGDSFKVRGIRLDSGDMATLSIEARKRLDTAGLNKVAIFVSGNLDEYAITDLLDADAPIDGFGVGTRMGTSADAPTIDFSYKLTNYEGRDRVKLSAGKQSLPGPQQIYRMEEGGIFIKDTMSGAEEANNGTKLMFEAMRNGIRTQSKSVNLQNAAQRTQQGLRKLPSHLHALSTAATPYEVNVSPALLARRQRIMDAQP